VVVKYASKCQIVAQKLKLQTLNLYSLWEGKEATYLGADGLHISNEGYRHLWGELSPLIPVPKTTILPSAKDPQFIELLHNELAKVL